MKNLDTDQKDNLAISLPGTSRQLDRALSSNDSAELIGVLELRNYVLKPGRREAFTRLFEEDLIQPQEALHGYPLGQYRVKGNEDNFCWFRGFTSMKSRSSFLPSFYFGPVWKQYRTAANAMIVNNDNVYLLRPLVLQQDSLVPVKGIDRALLYPGNKMAVVDFYISNTKLDQLLKTFSRSYLAILDKCGIHSYSLWVSELEENDFPRLPVFQDKNLLVAITFYDNETDYAEKMKKVNSQIDEDLKTALEDGITLKHTLILYPTKKTMAQ
jgi:NIPSNAP